MKEDIAVCRQLGCDAISVGAQNIHAGIDTERLKRIVEWAGSMGVTCNRAFDGTPDPFKALEDVISCGCERILTSGQKTAAPDAAVVLAQLVQQAGDRISIMPGAGVNSSNIAKLREACGAWEFHASARRAAPNPLLFINTEMNDYGSVYITDKDEVKAMVGALG